MSAVSLLSTLKEKPTDDSQKDEVNQSGHDENSISGGNGDPAVLAMGPVRKTLTYTRDELMRIRNSPLVKQGLENAFAGNEVMALVLKRRSDSPHEEEKGAKGDAPNENHKGIFSRERDRERRSADPRERVRKESESGGGIVLSPQRRLFTSGCGAPGAPVAQPPPQLARTRPESPLSATAPQTVQKTEQAGRRIGSGRIMVRDVPTSGWEENEYRPTAEIYRPPGALRERERERDRDRDRGERDRDRDDRRDDRRTNGDRFERRSFGRDSFSSDMKRERDDRFNNDKHRDREDNRRSGRYGRRYDKEDEPEWFSGGPTSQLETIELRGFDEPVKKTNGKEKEKENEKWNNNNGSQSPVEKWRKETSSPNQTETANTTSDKDSGVESKPEEPAVNNDQPDFNLDEFLQFDQIPEVLTNGTGDTEESRFSRWFRRESPTNDSKHYERLMHNMVDDLDNSTKIEPPTSTMNMSGMPMGGMLNGVTAMNNLSMGGFMEQPFNPPASTPSLLDLLRANPYPDERPELNSNVSGKIHSLEELEARLRPQPPAHAQPPPTDRDLSAFKRLLAQVSGGHVVPADRARAPPTAHHAHHNAPAQPMSLLQMLNKSLEKQQQQQQQQQQQKVQQQPHIPPELLYKLLHVQRQQQAPSSEMGPVGLSNADRELLQRPEAQAIIHGLKAGEITVQHLMQQLGNPGLQSRHREVLLTILRLNHQRQQMVGSPLPNVNPHLGVSHHQPLRLSPVPQTGRIPSPREMIHSQSLMQGAILKKKLEERHRREMQQQQIKHPTPISFTPTSVLRKMTAEKESDSPSPKQWSQPHKLPQGRPIVKGNQSGGAPMGYAPSPSDYHYMSQQPMSGVRQFPHQQPRQPVNNTFNMNMSRGMSGGTTLHQLLVNSHQRSLNEVNSGGGDNQLAKWFSPELLARASEGKLPSVHVPNALSLEDLERHHHSPAPPVRN